MRLQKIATALAGVVASVHGLGQEQIVHVGKAPEDAFRLSGAGQILVSGEDYWGVIRAAGDLAVDFGRVTGTNLTLSNGEKGASPATFEFEPVDVRNNTHFSTTATQSFEGPKYSDPDATKTVIIAGTIGHSKYIDSIIEAGKIDVSQIKGQWEAFVSKVVKDPVPGCSEALVIAGSMPRGTIYGLYDISEQMGVSPWYFWADVPIKTNKDIYATRGQKTQGPPSVQFRGLFLNDEQPGLTNWVATNWPDAWNDSPGYNHRFYGMVCELLLRLRANYLWPAIWGTILYTDDPLNQPLVYAYEVVLGSSHTEPLMRAQNEFGTYYKDSTWAYDQDNATIDEYFRYGVQRAKPYARNSVWTMAMRGTGDTAIEGLGVDVIVEMLETLVHNQRTILAQGLGVDDVATVPQSWCLYKEVQSYKDQGLEVPDDITLLWADDNWGNIRRLPTRNETARAGGAGVYYHFDYVGDPRSYKFSNTVQLEKTVEQMQLAYARQARKMWIVNVGDLKPLELPISHFLDIAYDAAKWDVDSTQDWLAAWATREFGRGLAEPVAALLTRFGRYTARRKFELVEAGTFSVLNYGEADAVLEQWVDLEEDARSVYEALDEAYQPAFFQVILHPVTAGRILNEIYIQAARNNLYAWQKRNAANEAFDRARQLLYDDANLTAQWDEMLGGKWEHMLDQTHLGFDGHWQQPMRNTLPQMTIVQETVTSLGGPVRIGVEASNASLPGDSKFQALSGNTLALPPLDPYGPRTRYFDVFAAGPQTCGWQAAPWEDWVVLSQYNGTVGPEGGADARVLVSVDWDKAPQGRNESLLVNINVTTPCRGLDRYAYRESVLQLPVRVRGVPDNFTDGFVEGDGYVAIEAPHFQSVVAARSSNASGGVKYHTFTDYGRTLGGVGLVPLGAEKLALDDAPALQYEVYLFSNHTSANVTLHLSPSQNFLGEHTPLEYAIALFPAGTTTRTEPERVRFVGKTEGADMPAGWGHAVADNVWGVHSGNSTTTTLEVHDEGAYSLRIWALTPGVVVQRIVLDLGGVRESYLGPPESFRVGKDVVGERDGTSVLGGDKVKRRNQRRDERRRGWREWLW